MEITLYNIRDVIFLDPEIQKKLFIFKNIFDQWKIANSVGGMESRLKNLELDLLNLLNKEHEEILNKHFMSKIKIKKIKNNLSADYRLPINSENLPGDIREYREFCVSANSNQIYLTLWR